MQLIEELAILPTTSPDPAAACERVRTSAEADTGKTRKLYVESYGCQMNFSDSEIVTSIMQDEGFRYHRRLQPGRRYLLEYLFYPR